MTGATGLACDKRQLSDAVDNYPLARASAGRTRDQTDKVRELSEAVADQGLPRASAQLGPGQWESHECFE